MSVFHSFFLGGFECSTQRLRSAKRLDLIAATGHDRLVCQDYRQLQEYGIHAARDGLRWHLIERSPGRYDWSSVLPMVRAAAQTGMQVMWDVFHYGYPDGVDIWKPAFVERFARFAGAFARLLRDESDQPALLCPMNEISFVSWAGGDVHYLNPFASGRGMELKTQLVRASIAAIEAIWDADPRARIALIDPIIHIVADPERPHQHQLAADYVQVQYQAWDMLAGRQWPQLGGDERYLDLLGVNYYVDNQWIHEGPTLDIGHPQYRPVQELLLDVYRRYERPIFIGETGIEGERRAAWLRYIGGEVQAAIAAGAQIEGVCLYPVLDYLGWDDERHCETGLFGLPDAHDRRAVHHPLAEELRRQQARFEPAGAAAIRQIKPRRSAHASPFVPMD